MAKVVNYQVLVSGHHGPVTIKADTVKHLNASDGIGPGALQFLTADVEVARFASQSVIGYWID